MLFILPQFVAVSEFVAERLMAVGTDDAILRRDVESFTT